MILQCKHESFLCGAIMKNDRSFVRHGSKMKIFGTFVVIYIYIYIFTVLLLIITLFWLLGWNRWTRFRKRNWVNIRWGKDAGRDFGCLFWLIDFICLTSRIFLIGLLVLLPCKIYIMLYDIALLTSQHSSLFLGCWKGPWESTIDAWSIFSETSGFSKVCDLTLLFSYE